MNEYLAFYERNRNVLSTSIRAVGQFLMTGLVRSGDCILPNGQFIEDCTPRLNGLNLLAFKLFSRTSEFERQLIKLENDNPDY